MKVGFIGLGRMGQVMSRRLVEAGHEVAAYNRTAEKAKALAEFGVKAVELDQGVRRLPARRCSPCSPTTRRSWRS